MKRNDEKTIEKALLENIEVPDGVLDAAMRELKAENAVTAGQANGISSAAPAYAYEKAEETKAGVLSRGKKARLLAAVPALAVTIIVLAVLVVFFSLPRTSYSNQPAYSLSSLEKRNTGPISSYNEENGTAYLCFENAEDGYAYADGGTDILLSENFSLDGAECVLYVLTDASGPGVDILDDFYDACASADAVGGTEIFFDGETFALSYFYREDAVYFLSVSPGEETMLFSLLDILLTD